MNNPTPEHKKQMKEFAKLGGWSQSLSTRRWSHPSMPPMANTREALPDFSTNLQACFDVLEHFCAEQGYWYRLRRGTIYCMEIGLYPDPLTSVTCETKQQAIIQAVLSAARAGEEK